MSNKRKKITVGFTQDTEDLYEFLSRRKGASALVRRLVTIYLSGGRMPAITKADKELFEEVLGYGFDLKEDDIEIESYENEIAMDKQESQEKPKEELKEELPKEPPEEIKEELPKEPQEKQPEEQKATFQEIKDKNFMSKDNLNAVKSLDL